MNNYFKLMLFILSCVLSQVTYAACTQTGNSLSSLVGVGYAGVIYANVTSVDNQCSCTTVRFYESNVDTNKVLSILLAAKFANKKVRVDFIDANDCDTADRVYIE